MQDKRLVILGCGYIGSALAVAARVAGAHVSALTRNPATAAALRAAGVNEVVEADLFTLGWQSRLPAGVDYAVNCVSAGGAGISAYRRTYVDGMRAVIAWAAAGPRPVGTLLYTGSTGVYPQGGGVAVDESAPTGGSDARGEALVEAENLLRCNTGGIDRWFILRLAGIYGPGRHHLLDQLREGAPSLPGPAGHRLNLAHRDDIVAAILACLTAPANVGNEVFNVADGAPATKAEIVHWLCARLGRPEPRFADPAGTSRRSTGAADRVILSGKLQSRLGWRPHYPDYREGYAALL
ncbi:MAG: NAD-dependent epimerase/dehydratase family protein [Opitutales bacterium]